MALPEPRSSGANGLYWVAISALLAVLAQVAAVVIPGRSGINDPHSLVAFQSMLSSAPWIGLMALGADKLARRLAVERGDGTLAWLLACGIPSLGLLGIPLGALLAHLFGDPAIPWVIFCAVMAMSAALNAGRELLIARGELVRACRIHAMALAAAIGAMVLSFVGDLGLTGLALAWGLPMLAIGAASCKVSNIFSHAEAPSLATGFATLGASIRLAAPLAGLALLASLDVAIARSSLPEAQALTYILLTRSIFVSFAASSIAAARWAPGLLSAEPRRFRISWTKCFLTHAVASMMALAALITFGPWALALAVPGFDAAPALASTWPSVATLALSRSMAEASFGAVAGTVARRATLWMGMASCAGLAVFAWAAPGNLEACIYACAAAWLLPSLALWIRLWTEGILRR